jgi:Protein of unknown function (DUF3667)
MSHKSNKKVHPYCLNCHYPISEFDKNCSQCGQKPTDGKTTLHDLMHEFVHTLFHLDGKFFTTLRHLFVPGKLTLEFFKGHHKRYAHPVQLFLVVGALTFSMVLSQAKSLEEKAELEMAKSQKKVIRNQFLMELDSISRSVAVNLGQEGYLLRDSVMLKMKFKKGIKVTDRDIKFALEQLMDEKLKKRNKNSPVSIRFTDENYNKFKDSLISTIMKEDVKAIDSLLKATKDSLDKIPKSVKNDFMSGYNSVDYEKTPEGIKEALREKRLELLLPTNIKKAIKIEQDSFDIFAVINFSENERSLKIPLSEIYEKTPDEILEKYNITDFYERIEAKPAIKVRKNATTLLHFLLSKLFLLTFLLIPFLSLFFMLLYRRQKRYYVEHFVFFLHLNTTLFLTLAAALAYYKLFGNEIIFAVYSIVMLLFIFLAMKFYYQQGWIKTFIKYSITIVFYQVFAIIFFTLAAIVSYFLF